MLREVYKIAIGSRLITVLFSILTYLFTSSYDSSAEIQLESNKLLTVFLRWDALYFLHIAEKGYVYEQETAFFPVMPLLSRLLAHTLFLPFQQILGERYTLLLSGVTIANISFVLAAGVLYKLTVTLLPKNPQLAMVSSIAFCLSPPAMFMSSFYTESLFALMSFMGMLSVARKKYLKAAIIWGITSGIRSNAIIYSGFFFYDLVWMRLIQKKNVITGLMKSIVYSIITAVGFSLFQYYGYLKFCSLERPWCQDRIPLLYSFVQKEYWNNGFLTYYEVKQIPNFLLAAPIILLSIFGLKSYIQADHIRFWTINTIRTKTVDKNSFWSTKLSVYMYLWLFLLGFVTTNMHVQVIIRFFTSLPPLYWFVAHLWIKGFKQGQNTIWANAVLAYFVLYGLVGIVLFSSFLPPA